MVVDNAPIGLPRLGGLAIVPGSAKRAVLVAEVSQREDPQAWYQRALRDDGSTAGVNVQRLPVTSLSAHDREATRGFTRHTLERMDGPVRPLALPADRYMWAPSVWCVLVNTERRVVSHAGILYRLVQVGEQRLAVGSIGGVMMLLGRGYARAALKKAQAFVAVWLGAPFACACPLDEASFYRHLGWRVADAPITCEQPARRVTLAHEVAVVLPCQGDAFWPSGAIDLCGAPW